MSHDTTATNRTRQDLGNHQSIWLFGYGSLIYKTDFPFLESRPARIHGWKRRFWQGSHDHRGTPDSPGRVATLVADEAAVCSGMAYRVEPKVFEQLDVREKNGYLRHVQTLEFADGSSAEGLVYIADETNAAWLGPATEQAIAEHVAHASGPSGSNREYVLRLACALQDLGEDDPHVSAIARHLGTR